MITEEQEYRAEIVKITGLAFMTPIARIFLDPFTFVQQHNVSFVFNYFLYSLFIATVGLILIIKAHGILVERSKK